MFGGVRKTHTHTRQNLYQNLFFFFRSTTLLLPTHLPPPSCTHAQSCNPMDFSPPGSSVHDFPKQEYWSGLPLPSPQNLNQQTVSTCSKGSQIIILLKADVVNQYQKAIFQGKHITRGKRDHFKKTESLF